MHVNIKISIDVGPTLIDFILELSSFNNFFSSLFTYNSGHKLLVIKGKKLFNNLNWYFTDSQVKLGVK